MHNGCKASRESGQTENWKL